MDSAQREAAMLEARKKLAEKFGDNTRIGGKGSMRRKKKTAHKTTANGATKILSALKRFGVQPLPQIEEVNMFTDDQTIIHLKNPAVHANLRDNVFLVSGHPETKTIREMMPGILTQLGPKNLEYLKQFADEMQKGTKPIAEENEDEEIPSLVEGENFEDVSKKEGAEKK